jgi:aspartyl-tRNA(Asn)/glutamyl-tRNA(Gln) amidotransferase subunit B
MAAGGKTAAAIVAEKGLVQISDAGKIGAVVDRILAANAGQVAAYRSGKTKIFGFFVGQVMKETRGKANPRVVNDLLRQKLERP